MNYVNSMSTIYLYYVNRLDGPTPLGRQNNLEFYSVTKYGLGP